MDFASICVGANLLGYGAFSSAFAVPGDHRTVVLLETTPGNPESGDPQRYAYMAWCAARLKKYGLRSPQMAMLPEVYWVGMFDGKRCCVMRRYYRNSRDAGGCAFNDKATERAMAFRKAYQRVMTADDLHGGNMWWCPERHQWIVSDPIAECNDPPEFDAPLDFVAVKARKVAQWKQPRIR